MEKEECIRFIEGNEVNKGRHVFDSQGECMICGAKGVPKEAVVAAWEKVAWVLTGLAIATAIILFQYVTGGLTR